MPRPVFDIEQYELRLIEPDVFTKEQQDRLNLVTARVNQQLDWTSQLLGMSGTNYWGLADLRNDKYTWNGLPETPNEKRQLQATAFGVYAKDKPYEERPAPFNRSEIKASGDQGFQIWEANDLTYLSPLGGTKQATFNAKPYVFAGGSYVFDYEVEFTTSSNNDAAFYSYNFQGVDRTWTRLFINMAGELIGVRRKGSKAAYCYIIPIEWEDSSDWKSQKVLDDYIGLWGNKGNNFSFDAALDALDVHGFDEVQALTLKDTLSCFTMEDLLETVGLRATPWTGYYNTKFGFKINDGVTVYPLPPQSNNPYEPNLPSPFEYYEYNGCNFKFKLTQTSAIPTPPPNVDYNGGVITTNNVFNPLPRPECRLDDGVLPSPAGSYVPPEERIDDGVYPEFEPHYWPCYSFNELAISELCFEYIPDPNSPCALLDLPCLEWLFDPTLDDGVYDIPILGPLAWAIADDGDYDQDPLTYCYYDANQGAIACDDGAFCGFDDGFYGAPELGGTEQFVPNCDPVPPEPCPTVDGGYLNLGTDAPPDYDIECDCAVECCDINGGVYVYGEDPEFTDCVINGGVYLEFDICTTYDNDVYDRDPLDVICSLDNGTFADVVIGVEDSGLYDRVIPFCPPCDPENVDVIIPCPLDPVRVNLKQWSDDFAYKMEPNVANSLTPLRVWKSRPLTVTDTVPADGLESYNFLVADDNKGPDPFDSFRYYLRLPLEYPRNGKFWNRAIAVASNQGYFSAPSHLSETQNDPEVFRPRLYDEAYNNYELNPPTVYYSEPYLVSTIRTDSQGYDQFFEDAAITYEEPEVNPYAPAVIMDYDPFALRIPFANGEWKGEYFVQGTVQGIRTGYIDDDTADGLMIGLLPKEYPVWDESRIKRPDLEFPDTPDEASLKDYVVSYAYFAADFAAADDPVFDPDNEICWRKEEVACYTAPNEGEATFNQSDDCTLQPRPINSAYLLHHDRTTTQTQTPEAVLAVAVRDEATEQGYAGGNPQGGGGY